MAFPGRDIDAVGGTFGFLSSFQPQPNHESGPPGLQTDVLGLVVACHPAQQQPLPEQEETQGDVRGREHQAKAWRVSQSGISRMAYNCGACISVLWLYRRLFCMLLYSVITNMVWKGKSR